MPTRKLSRHAQSIIRRLPIERVNDEKVAEDYDQDEYTPGEYRSRRGDTDDEHGTDLREKVRLKDFERTLIGGTIGEGILAGAAAIKSGQEAEVWPEDEAILVNWVLFRCHFPDLVDNPQMQQTDD